MSSFIYGRRSMMEVLIANKRRVHRVFFAVGAHGPELDQIKSKLLLMKVQFEEVPRGKLDRWTHDGNHQGVVAKVGDLPQIDFRNFIDDLAMDPPPLLVALDEVMDPQNIGVITRSCCALGAQALILPQWRSGGVTDGAEKASAGAMEHLPLITAANLGEAIRRLKDKGFWIFGADGAGKVCDSLDLKGPAVLVMGNEGKGLRPLIRELCDQLVAIPQVTGGVASLNVAQATSILLYEIQRQRRQ